MRLTQRAKVVLLAGTYLDLMEGELIEGGGGHGQFGTRAPRHSDTWDEGSYHELGRVLDALRLHARFKHAWLWRVYVQKLFKLEDIAPHKKHAAEQGLSMAVELMLKKCNGNIYVPRDVSENAGYDMAEARAHGRPRKRAAA